MREKNPKIQNPNLIIPNLSFWTFGFWVLDFLCHMEKKYVANKAFLVNPSGKILLVRDSKQSNSVHLWDVPGGRMDRGENILDGLAREVIEETGIVIDPKKAKRFFVDLWGVNGDILNEPVVGMFYVVDVGECEVTLSHEHIEFLWYDPHTPIPEPSHSFTRNAIEAYRKSECVATCDEAIKGRQGYGLIQVFTGNGKGKTTAALGEVLRSVGVGKKVAIIFFDKGGEHYSERVALEKLGVEWHAFGRDRVDAQTGRFDFSVTDEDRRLGACGLDKARSLLQSDQYDLLVLDEVNSATDLGILSVQLVLSVLDLKPARTEIILTGRNAPQEFLDRAHLVTEMRMCKHYFYSGVKAREGLDY
jgi:cob(I)alamin adenosyltransferase